MAMIEWADTLACLAVEATRDGVYTAPNIPMPYRRVYGGQVLAQLVAVAEASADPKQVKSLHVVLPREGELERALEFDVDAPQTGRAFATRAVRVHQADRAIAQATISLHAPEASAVSHQLPAPTLAGPGDATPVDLSMIPWSARAVGGVDLAAPGIGAAESAYWMKTPALDDAPACAHRALLAFATTLTLVGTALRPHAGLSEASIPDRVQTAVTSHTVWFHAGDLRVDDWWLLVQSAPSLAGARGHGRGDVFDAAGRLVASFAQESLIRPVEATEA